MTTLVRTSILVLGALVFSALPAPGAEHAFSHGGDLSQPGPHQAAWTEVTVRRPDNSTFKAVLYYPATTPGSGGTYDPSAAPYPAISFGHGFLQAVEQYQSTLSHLATWGYFVIASRSQGGLFPSHSAFAADLRHCLTYLESEHADPASWLFQQVAVERLGMSGHSMGGGASILATAADARVKALANLAAAETNPSAISAMTNIAVPVSLVAGSEDSIVPPGSNGQLMYNNARPPRQLPIILGGYHCGFIDQDYLFCDSGSITRPVQLALTRRVLTAFFNLYLKNDQTVWRQVWGPEFLADPAFDNTRVDAGLELTPAQVALTGPAGQPVGTDLTLKNTGLVADHFALFVEDHEWNTSVAPAQTGLIQPGETTTIRVTIEIPGGPGANADQTLVSARAERDGGTRAFAVVVTTRRLLGDLNCDGAVDFGDINPFVLALSNPTGYAAAYPNCDRGLADVNQDGRVDFGDINPFVRLLTNP